MIRNKLNRIKYEKNYINVKILNYSYLLNQDLSSLSSIAKYFIIYESDITSDEDLNIILNLNKKLLKNGLTPIILNGYDDFRIRMILQDLFLVEFNKNMNFRSKDEFDKLQKILDLLIEDYKNMLSFFKIPNLVKEVYEQFVDETNKSLPIKSTFLNCVNLINDFCKKYNLDVLKYEYHIEGGSKICVVKYPKFLNNLFNLQSYDYKLSTAVLISIVITRIILKQKIQKYVELRTLFENKYTNSYEFLYKSTKLLNDTNKLVVHKQNYQDYLNNIK